MKKYVAAALTIGITVGPASALDAGIGGNVGGVGVGAGVSAGSQGGSVGVGTSVDGVGGANVGASVGSDDGSVDAGVSASGTVGDTGGGISTDVGVGDDPAAENESVTAPGSPAAATTATASAKTARQSIVLPPVLLPSKPGDGGSERVTKGYPAEFLAPLKAKTGTPAAVVRACRAAIVSAATPLGAVRVHAVSAGALRQRRGALTAPIEVRIDYARQGGIEVRQAQVSCRLDASGRVTAII
ncbi:hypothetical protein NKI82_23480 [Mesorhizobium sp. M0482]|uniref:hypothetical protein n=1 Tax=unclassified Mesorhizobium TaxID=325217 RepID=UPI0033394DDE